MAQVKEPKAPKDLKDSKEAKVPKAQEAIKIMQKPFVPDFWRFLLNQLPYSEKRQRRIESALKSLVLQQFETLTAAEQIFFEANLAKSQPLQFESFKNKVNGDINCAWFGTKTFGFSFGMFVFCDRRSSFSRHPEPTFDDLRQRVQTKEQFYELCFKANPNIRRDGQYDGRIFPYMFELLGDYILHNEREIDEVHKWMKRSNCTCLDDAIVNGEIYTQK